MFRIQDSSLGYANFASYLHAMLVLIFRYSPLGIPSFGSAGTESHNELKFRASEQHQRHCAH